MICIYKDLRLIELEEEEREKHGGYKYLVHSSIWNNSAFYTLEGLNYWLKITGLKRGEKDKFNNNVTYLIGQYSTVSILSKYFYSGKIIELSEKLIDIRKDLLNGSKSDYYKNCTWLNNGSYTKGYIEKTEEGNTIYYLNPNEHKRIIYPYAAIKR